MNLRTKLILNITLLALALSCTILAANAEMSAFQGFRRQDALARAGDVRTIRSWMTIPYIAHAYHVPTTYLYQTLHITDKYPSHSTLQALAIRYHRPTNALIHDVQVAITVYRRDHPWHNAIPHQQQIFGGNRY